MKNNRFRKQLFEAAWKIIETEGIEKLNVRKLAKLSSCSLGSIYNAFGSFQELQLHLNAKILAQLYAMLHETLEKGIREKKSLRLIFRDMGLAYIEYGQNNLFLWKTLFEYLPFDPLPDWYIKHTREGIYQICDRLSSCFDLSGNDSKQIVGFFWTGIHGMSAIFLNQKMKMVSELFGPNSFELYIEYCLDGLFKEVPNAQLVFYKS